MTDTKKGEAYTPLFPFDVGLDKDQHFLCFDQAKTNLFWLVEPRIDTEGIAAAHKNPIAEAIDKHMDACTRSHLERLPHDFLTYWTGIDNGSTVLAQAWPAGYAAGMASRAASAQRRLTVLGESGNVVRVNFRRKEAA